MAIQADALVQVRRVGAASVLLCAALCGAERTEHVPSTCQGAATATRRATAAEREPLQASGGAHLNLHGPAMRVARKLLDRACPGCLNVSLAIRQGLNKKTLSQLNLGEMTVNGEVMMHLPGHVVAESAVDRGTTSGAAAPACAPCFVAATAALPACWACARG